MCSRIKSYSKILRWVSHKNPVEIPFVASICERFFRKEATKVNEGGNGNPRNKHLAWVSSREGSCVTQPPDVWLVLVSWKSWRDTVIRSTWYFYFNQWKEPLMSLPSRKPVHMPPHGKKSPSIVSKSAKREKDMSDMSVSWRILYILLHIFFVPKNQAINVSSAPGDPRTVVLERSKIACWAVGDDGVESKQAVALQLQDGEDHGDVCWVVKCKFLMFSRWIYFMTWSNKRCLIRFDAKAVGRAARMSFFSNMDHSLCILSWKL